MSFKIIYKTVGKWNENSYLLESSSGAWLIDPGDDFEVLDKFFDGSKKNLKGIINTHAHFDHIGAVHEFKTNYGIPFYIHSKDKQLVRQGNLYKKLAGESGTFTTPAIDGFIDEMPAFELNGETVKVHETPGHTNGSVCFEIGTNLISGDLFFKDALGRIDLPGGNHKLLIQSVRYVLDHFIGYTIYPGHGNPFVLDEEVSYKLQSLL